MTRALVIPLGIGLALLGACREPEPADESLVGPLVRVSSPAGPGSAEPNLTTGPDGRVYLSWIEPAPDSASELRFAVLEGEQWSEPRTIARGSDWFVNWADFPALAVLPGGRMFAHYLQRDPHAQKGYHYSVRLVRSQDGGTTWSAPQSPHRDSVPAEHGFVSFVPTGDSLGVVWLDGRKTNPRFGGVQETMVRFTTVGPDGGMGPEVALDERTCDCCQTAAAQTSRGPVVVYRDRSQDEIRDIYVTRRVDGRWTAGEPVHADGWKIEACPVNGPAIAADGERVVVAWFTGAGDTARVLVAFSADAGATFSVPSRVDGGNPAGRVGVQLLRGGALVSWIERTAAGGAEVHARVMPRQGKPGNPLMIAQSSGERASGFPRMVRAGDEVVFAWTEPGDKPRVRSARLRIGGES